MGRLRLRLRLRDVALRRQRCVLDEVWCGVARRCCVVLCRVVVLCGAVVGARHFLVRCSWCIFDSRVLVGFRPSVFKDG